MWRPIAAGFTRVSLFVERHPLFPAALAAGSCVFAADRSWGWGIVAVVVCLTLGHLLKGWKTGLAWAACGAIAASCFLTRESSRLNDERVLRALPVATVHGTVLRDARAGGEHWRAPVKLLDGPRPGALVWWEGNGEVPVAGAVAKGRGKFYRLEGARNPGEFDRAIWLHRQGISVGFNADYMAGTVTTGSIAKFGHWLRRGFRSAVTTGLDENSREAAVIRAVVIGETPPDAEELIAAFRNSGTLHAFSVSGLHVTMLGATAWMVLRLFGVPRRKSILLLLVAIFGYAWITGNSPPAVRSAWMAAVFLGAFLTRRRPDLLNSLAAVLLVATLWNGRLLFLPGVQLSYGVVAAIAIGGDLATRWFAWMAKPELYLPVTQMNRWQRAWLGFRRNTSQSVAVSVVAAAGSTPLTVYHFGLVTPVSIPAGVIMIPLFYGLLVLGLLGTVLGPLPPLASFVNQANAKLAKLTITGAEAFANLPGGHFQFQGDRSPALLVYALDGGAGAASFADTNGRAVLFDCGDRYGFDRIIAPSLQRRGILPDTVTLSHPDSEHIGGGSEVWKKFPIRRVLLPVEKARSVHFRNWLEAGEQLKVMFPGEEGEIPMPDGARLEILNVPDPFYQSLAADERVAVFRLHWRGWKILLTSDAGLETERLLIESGVDLSADLIIAGSHATQACPGEAFLDHVRPLAIIAHSSDRPANQRLRSVTVKRWESRGVTVLNQRITGAVTIRVDPAGNLRLEGFADRSALSLKPR